MKRTVLSFFGLLLAIMLPFTAASPVLAQDGQESGEKQPLVIYTQYPSQMIGFGETVTVQLKVRAGTPQIVNLELEDLPEGWNASFRGGSRIIDSVYLNGENEVSVDLRLEPPEDVEAGQYTMTVKADGPREDAEIPLRFTVEEKLPPQMSLSIDGLPTKRGTPSSTFTYTVSLKNEGGEDLLVALSATQPKNTRVTIESSGQEVTELELPANETKNLTVKADPLINLEAGKYPFTVQAVAGDVRAELQLVAEVIGTGDLKISAPDGRLSGSATAGAETPLKLVLANNGTAPLRGVELSSREPSGWSITFDQQQIAEIPAGESVEVTARIKPPEKAVAGDYMVTINARPVDSSQKSAEFRITVRTSTLWGIAGIGLIAVAVGVVGMAVVRFGRR